MPAASYSSSSSSVSSSPSVPSLRGSLGSLALGSNTQDALEGGAHSAGSTDSWQDGSGGGFAAGSRQSSYGSASGFSSAASSAVSSPRRRLVDARPSEWVVADYVSKRHHKHVDDGGHTGGRGKPESGIRKIKSQRRSDSGGGALSAVRERCVRACVRAGGQLHRREL